MDWAKADAFMQNAHKARDQSLLASYLIAGIAILIGAAVALFLTRSIVKPLGAAVALAETMSTGNFRRTLEDKRADEIGALVKALNKMAESMEDRPFSA